MIKLGSLLGTILLVFPLFVHASSAVGFKEIHLDKNNRRLDIAIWYPTKHKNNTVTIGENQIFYGDRVVQNGKGLLSQNKYPLVVLSHGYGGSWRNLSWLAYELASQGYVVAAPNHPGTTAFDRDKIQSSQLWERPNDLSKVIDAISIDVDLANKIDLEKISAIGYSLGGWTVVALAGGLFDTQLFKKECENYTEMKACQLVSELGLNNPQLEKSMKDPRVKAMVSLDLGLARGFTAKSLMDISVPSLIIGAGTDIGDMPVDLESGYLKSHLAKKRSTFVNIPDAMHFSFMQVCKSNAIELLNKESPGDGIICKDGGQREREEIHREVTFLITGFLSQIFSDTPAEKKN